MAFCCLFNKLAHDPYDVVTWCLLLLLPQWCLVLCLEKGGINHRETKIQFKKILVGDGENLEDEFFLWAQTLATISNLMPPIQHDFPTHKCFFHSLVHGHIKKYFKTTHILAPFFHVPTSSNTTSVSPSYILNQMISFRF
jgi:hypothetical protein